MRIRSKRSTGVAGIVLLLMSLVVAVGLPAVGAVVAPILVVGNADCEAATGLQQVIKIEPPSTGTYHFAAGSVTITLQAGNTFDWSSTAPMAAVFVKGGPDGNLYDYRPAGATSHTGLHAPTNPNNGEFYGLSHITFCVPDTTTTSASSTSTSSTSTSSTSLSTTSTSSTSTSTSTSTTSATTTSQPTATTGSTASTATVVVTVGGIQVSAPVPVAQVTQPTQETLPFTGPSNPEIAALAAALAVAGTLLIAASRQTEEKAPLRSWN